MSFYKSSYRSPLCSFHLLTMCLICRDTSMSSPIFPKNINWAHLCSYALSLLLPEERTKFSGYSVHLVEMSKIAGIVFRGANLSHI